MDEDFQKRSSKIINGDRGIDLFGIKQTAQYRTVSGVSNVTSWVGFLEPVDDDDLVEIPDYILSSELEKDLTVSVNVCARALRESKYLPVGTRIEGGFGLTFEEQGEGAYLLDWRDFQIPSVSGEPLYTAESFTDHNEREALAAIIHEASVFGAGKLFPAPSVSEE